jgi:polyferredoxin
MRKVKKPAGLIRYGSQQSLQTGERTRVLRPRLVIYSALVVAFVSALAVAVATREPFEVTILRGLGAPFALRGEQVTNQIRIKVKNRSSSAHTYRIELLDAGGAEFIAAENPLHVADAAQITTSVFVLSETSGFERGERRVRFRITDESGLSLELPYKLLGPKELE